ncbi:hypothetical protein GT347_05975 [Xylophilus rhododendri]|uniref:Secreted protein n=1 Tax=Xylophilus rhododendri TaxID=2697032 RepID=A0A857J113_9BURK|nr:hypothetical protein [Xylophilus rhododendri]QHI97574.1 hypothetical protein GT347_05975 [Xylophilus rhododendri]
MNRRIAPALLAAASLAVTTAAWPAEAARPAPRPQSVSQRLQQHFVATVEGWRKVRLRPLEATVESKDQKPTERQATQKRLYEQVEIVVVPTPIPIMRSQQRINGSTVYVSAGWLSMVNEMLWAGELHLPAAQKGAPGSSCLTAYQDTLFRYAMNQDRVQSEAFPRVAALFETRCEPPRGDDPERFARKQRIDAAFEQTTVRFMDREMDTLFERNNAGPGPDGADRPRCPPDATARYPLRTWCWLETHDFLLRSVE